MRNSMASSIAPLPSTDASRVEELRSQPEFEQPRDFHFAVTWIGLFAHLDPVKSTGPRTRMDAAPARALVPVVASPALVPVVVSNPLLAPSAPFEPFPDNDSNAGWEMVVPKMIRTGTRTFVPDDDVSTGDGKAQ
jgi:hypothetical protein